jgi:hypothetical protein
MKIMACNNSRSKAANQSKDLRIRRSRIIIIISLSGAVPPFTHMPL